MSYEEQGNRMSTGAILPCVRCAKALFWMKQENQTGANSRSRR